MRLAVADVQRNGFVGYGLVSRAEPGAEHDRSVEYRGVEVARGHGRAVQIDRDVLGLGVVCAVQVLACIEIEGCVVVYADIAKRDIVPVCKDADERCGLRAVALEDDAVKGGRSAERQRLAGGYNANTADGEPLCILLTLEGDGLGICGQFNICRDLDAGIKMHRAAGPSNALDCLGKRFDSRVGREAVRLVAAALLDVDSRLLCLTIDQCLAAIRAYAVILAVGILFPDTGACMIVRGDRNDDILFKHFTAVCANDILDAGCNTGCRRDDLVELIRMCACARVSFAADRADAVYIVVLGMLICEDRVTVGDDPCIALGKTGQQRSVLGDRRCERDNGLIDIALCLGRS